MTDIAATPPQEDEEEATRARIQTKRDTLLLELSATVNTLASIGQVLVSFPGYLPLDAAVAGAAYYHPRLRRDPGAAVAVSSGVWVAAAVLWWRRHWPNPGGPPPDAAMASAAAVSSLVIALRFRQTAREAAR